MASDVFGHPWLSGLFGDRQTVDLLAPKSQLMHMIRIEVAYTRALGKAGVVANEISDAAIEHIQQTSVDWSDIKSGTAQDGVPVPALVRQLKRDAPINIHDAIHRGMTSQDVVDTALIMSLKDVISLFAQRQRSLTETFSEIVSNFGTNQISGRTRMQFARKISVADRVRTWHEPLGRHADRLQQIQPRLLVLQLGGGVGNRQDIGGKTEKIASEMASTLGLGNISTAWHTERSGIVEFADWLSLVTGSLGKFGQDISLMSQQGIDDVSLSNVGSSSTMPHKNNPVQAELLVTLARFNATQISGMHHAMVHEQERSGAAWSLEWMLLPQMVLATGRALLTAQQLCEQITGIGKN